MKHFMSDCRLTETGLSRCLCLNRMKVSVLRFVHVRHFIKNLTEGVSVYLPVERSNQTHLQVVTLILITAVRGKLHHLQENTEECNVSRGLRRVHRFILVLFSFILLVSHMRLYVFVYVLMCYVLYEPDVWHDTEIKLKPIQPDIINHSSAFRNL